MARLTPAEIDFRDNVLVPFLLINSPREALKNQRILNFYSKLKKIPIKKLVNEKTSEFAKMMNYFAKLKTTGKSQKKDPFKITQIKPVVIKQTMEVKTNYNKSSPEFQPFSKEKYKLAKANQEEVEKLKQEEIQIDLEYKSILGQITYNSLLSLTNENQKNIDEISEYTAKIKVEREKIFEKIKAKREEIEEVYIRLKKLNFDTMEGVNLFEKVSNNFENTNKLDSLILESISDNNSEHGGKIINFKNSIQTASTTIKAYISVLEGELKNLTGALKDYNINLEFYEKVNRVYQANSMTSFEIVKTWQGTNLSEKEAMQLGIIPKPEESIIQINQIPNSIKELYENTQKKVFGNK